MTRLCLTNFYLFPPFLTRNDLNLSDVHQIFDRVNPIHFQQSLEIISKSFQHFFDKTIWMTPHVLKIGIETKVNYLSKKPKD